jgi:hypothetical protein
MLRGRKQRTDGCIFDDLARIHDGDMVTNFGNHTEIVRYENYRDAG